jgi:hypothetical protein
MCTKKEAAQAVKRLKAEGLVVGEDRSGRHFVLLLSNGLRYVRGNSPSDWRSVRNMEADVRRMARPLT